MDDIAVGIVMLIVYIGLIIAFYKAMEDMAEHAAKDMQHAAKIDHDHQDHWD